MCKDMRDSSISMKPSVSKEAKSMSAAAEKDTTNSSKKQESSPSSSKSCGCDGY